MRIAGLRRFERIADLRYENRIFSANRFARIAGPSKKVRESETTIKIKFALFRGWVGRGAERKIVQNAIFHGKRHDNKILKVKILLSRNFVVMAQAPRRSPGRFASFGARKSGGH